MKQADFDRQSTASEQLQSYDTEKRCIMMARAALRSLGEAHQIEGAMKETYILLILRSALITAANSIDYASNQDALGNAAHHTGQCLEGSYDKMRKANALLGALRALDNAYWLSYFACGPDVIADISNACGIFESTDDHEAWFCYERDRGYSSQELLKLPVWHDRKPPEAALDAHANFWKMLNSHRDWAFWRRWYGEMWDGTFTDWHLAIEIAKLPNDLWWRTDALAHVAQAIFEIEPWQETNFERPNTVPTLARETLIKHVERLLCDPQMTALTAEGNAELIEKAISRYLQEAPANCLPAELAHLNDLPRILLHIANTVRSKELGIAKIERLADQIELLNTAIAMLEADVRDARKSTVSGLFTQSALKAAGTAFGASVVGSIGLGVAHFFGEWPSDMTLQNFRGWLSDLNNLEPKPDVTPLPPDFET